MELDRDKLRDDPDIFWKAWEEAGRTFPNMHEATGISQRTLENWSVRHRKHKPPEPEPEIVTNPVTAEAERLRSSQAQRVQRVETREAARTEIILEHLTQALAGFSPKMLDVRPPAFDAGKRRSPMGQVVVLGDWHYGEVVDPQQVMELNAYNCDIAARRIYHLEKLTLLELDIIGRAHPIPRLHIIILGDMVSGSIHSLAETNEVNEYEQFFGVTFLLAQFILRLSPFYEEICVYGVPGNHSRMTEEKRTKDAYVCWDWMAYEVLELLLVNQKNIVCDFPRSPFNVINLEGWDWLISHGGDIKSWGNLPIYGIERAVQQFTEMLQGKGRKFDYGMFAHFHQRYDKDRPVGEILINPSLVGGGEYSVNGLRRISRPQQRIFFMHHEHGLTQELRNDLSKGDDTPHPYKLPHGLSLAAAFKELVE